LHEFWSEEYPESLYLWQGAKHNSSLTEIQNCAVPTHKDLFSTQDEIQKGHDFCKSFYYRILPILASKLNTIHNLDLSVSFWQLVFGYWLYRHISIVYDKYIYLGELDIDATGIKLLSKNDFFIPQNHVDYIYCFASDFGVQQLVSQYYYLYKTKEIQEINSTFIYRDTSSRYDAMRTRLKRILLFIKGEPQVALLGTAFSTKNRKILKVRSLGKISRFNLPLTIKESLAPDFAKRSCIADSVIDNSFESYFIQSLYYCLPMDFLENFTGYYNIFLRDINSRKFTHIVSEDWISNIPNSIFIALAREDKKTFISLEHGACTCYYKNYMQFINYDVADIYLSVGWRKNSEKFIQGGFVCKDVTPYRHDPEKKMILFVGHTMPLYWTAFNEFHATNSTFIKNMKLAASIIKQLPSPLKGNFLFRPRARPSKDELLWDVERLLELDRHNIKCDRGNFSESLSLSRIVIIDHLSTGLAEILMMNVPFMLVHDVHFIPLEENFKTIFDDLTSCGVIHTSAESAVSHLSSIYDNVEKWWQSESVHRPVKQLIDASLAPASKTTDYLLSLLTEESMRPPNLLSRFWNRVIACVWLTYRLTNKIKSLASSRGN